jgi:hypothetical protein
MPECGKCTLCCRLLGVVELNKPPVQNCEFCPNEKGGCQRHDDLPPTCADFECGYLGSNLPKSFRPDKLHIIVTGEDATDKVHFLHVDPRYPDATKTRIGRNLIAMMRQQSFGSIIITTGDKTEIIEDDTKRAEFLRGKYSIVT